MDRKAALAELGVLLGDRFSQTHQDLASHRQDFGHREAETGTAILFPRSTSEIISIIDIALEAKLPIIPWGSATSLEGQVHAEGAVLFLDLRLMDRILRIRPADMNVTVQPGVTHETLNFMLRDSGLFFAVDPGANSSLGGMAATRASGISSPKYGGMRENTLGLQAVLGNGSVVQTGSRCPGGISGLDLGSLMIGSEGILGVITELDLQLRPKPEAHAVAKCAFDQIGDAIRVATDAAQAGLDVERMELLDANCIKALNSYSGSNHPEKPHLLMELNGSSIDVMARSKELAEIAADHQANPFQWSFRPEDREEQWIVRNHLIFALQTIYSDKTLRIIDISCPYSQLTELALETDANLNASALDGVFFGRIIEGRFQLGILCDPSRPYQLEDSNIFIEALANRAISLGGAVGAEYGIGKGKLNLMARMHGESWEMMRQIKSIFDPSGIMNPGKLVPSARLSG